MTGFAAALWVETLKARRSRVPPLTALGFSLAPLVGGLFMLILRDPEWARSTGLITAKAQITAGSADWPGYFALLAQTVAVGGFVLISFVAIWVFGREYSDRTAKDMLALPVSRAAVVIAKFAVVAGWSLVLAAIVYGLGLAVGRAIDLPGWSADLAATATGQLWLTAGLNVLLVTPVAWAACAGRGYLPPVGLMFLLVALAQILAVLGWGAYFPWAVPALASGAAGPEEQQLNAASYVLVALTGLLGILGTLAWWRWADQTA